MKVIVNTRSLQTAIKLTHIQRSFSSASVQQQNNEPVKISLQPLATGKAGDH
jgi:hypothetical protein